MKGVCEYLFNLRWEVSIPENKTCLGLKLPILFIFKKGIKLSENPNEACIFLERGSAFEVFSKICRNLFENGLLTEFISIQLSVSA